jgi:uncharacterized RDD family membrane protein YckC
MAKPRNSSEPLAGLMRYAGFWPRLFANLVDTVVGIPFIVLAWPGVLSKNASLFLVIPAFAVGTGYIVIMNALWGQTIGKMAARIRIVTVSGARIGWREALLRDAVSIGFGIISTAAHVATLLNVPASTWSEDWVQQAQLLSAAEPTWGPAATAVMNVWFWGELIVLLFNRKRRALHDFIAGTVVIHAPP